MGVSGETDPAPFGAALPIAGIAGDQQAALFGQACFAPGEAKNTYGTGCFLLANTGEIAAPARRGLLTTIAWDIGDGARFALESIAYQTRDLVEAMRAAGQPIDVLRADGGGTVNRFLMQFQSDLLGVPVEVAAVRETTALGAAFLAGLAVGVWKTPDELRKRR